MSFIQNEMVNGASTNSVKLTITNTAAKLGIDEDRALYLLLQYGWSEAAIAADISCLQKAANVFNRSVRPQRPFVNVSCSRCNTDDRCYLLDCGHSVCDNCLDAYVRDQLTAGSLLLPCPDGECTVFLNPTTLHSSRLSPDLRQDYARRLLVDFIANTRTGPLKHLQKGIQFVWNNRRTILDFGFVAAGALAAHKTNQWCKKNPRTCFELGILCNQVKEGDCPSDLTFWCKFFWKAKLAIRR